MIELLNELASILIKLACAGIVMTVSATVAPWIKKELIPWLKEKRLYEIVRSFVLAAEKMAESGAIDKEMKKRFVIDCLTGKGINVTDEILALIECAVEELDLAIESGFIMIGDAFDVVDAECDECDEAECFEESDEEAAA